MYTTTITRDDKEHYFTVPDGHDKNDPVISQMNIFSRTLDTQMHDYEEKDIAFLLAAFREYANPYVNYQALWCLIDVYRARPDLYTDQQANDLILEAEDRSYGAFTALAIGVAEAAVLSDQTVRRSPFLKYIYRHAAEGQTSALKNLALSTLNDIANKGPAHIRAYMFKRAKAEIDRSLENPRIPSELARDYYALTATQNHSDSDRENVLNKKDESTYQSLIGYAQAASAILKKQYTDADGTLRNSDEFWDRFRKAIVEAFKIEDFADVKKYLQLILNKNSWRDPHHIHGALLTAAAEYRDEMYDFLKEFIHSGVTIDLKLSVDLFDRLYGQMPLAERKKRAQDYFDLHVHALFAHQCGRFGLSNHMVFQPDKRSILHTMRLSEEQRETFRQHIQKAADSIGAYEVYSQGISGYPMSSRSDIHQYAEFVRIYRSFGHSDYAFAPEHEARLDAEQKERDAKKAARAAARRRNKKTPSNTLS